MAATPATIQILRMTSDSWEVKRASEVTANVWEYETLGRVVREGLYYFAETVKWKADGAVFTRQPKAFLLLHVAQQAVVNPPKRVLS